MINLSREDKKIGLSIRQLEESDERSIYKSYLNNNREATSNLGDLLRAGMLDLENRTLSENGKAEEDAGGAGDMNDSAGEDSASDRAKDVEEEDKVEGAEESGEEDSPEGPPDPEGQEDSDRPEI